MAKKDKKSKGKAGDWSEDEDDYMDSTPQEFGATAEAAPSTPEPSSAPAEADEGANDLMSALTRSKNKKTAKEEAKAAEERAEEDAKVQLKSKKEKEKEKKEREKLKKKQQAEKKKATQKAANIALTEQRAEAKAAAASSTPEPAKKADPKSKKKTSVSAALLKRIQAQKEAAEAQRLAEEEELKRIAEEEAKAAEAERLKEEARLRKKEKERQKKEELKAAGKFLTKKQKEQQALQERRRQQLLESGVYVEGLQGDAPKKKPVYGKKKSKKPEPTPEPKAAPSAPVTKEVKVEEKKPEPKKVEEKKPEPKKVEEPAAAPEEEEDAPLLDDWEAAIGSDGEVKDSWEELGDSEPEVEEEEEKKEEPVAQITKKVEEVKVSPKEEEPENATGPSALEKATLQASKRKEEIAEKREERHNAALSKANNKDLRSPICCILGHVDTGKTKLLDKIRQTNVQEGEAGGITQQIGATYFPIDAIRQKTEVMKKHVDFELNVPGLLMIDTPGHESFTNLRSRGSSLCNMAVLVIDIMHGLEQQTIESIRLLRDRKTPFIVALNKIDRLYGWEATPNNSFRDSFARQPSSVQREFQDRYEKAKLALAEQGLNSDLYFQNKNVSRNVSIVPTSAVTGEGVPDLLYLLLELTQTRMSKQLMYLSQLEATILEVKVVEGLGTTIDVVLSNGVLREGDRIVLCGQNGPIATNVRALLTPQPLRELRIKSAYVHHKEVKAALGVKIAANDLEKAVAGSRLLLVGPDDDEEELMDDIMDDLTGLLDSVDKSGRGVCVQASTLGSLEALLSFLKDMKIPVMAISIGPVYKRDIMRATAMLEKAPEFALMLAFDVKIDKEAEQYAQEQGIKIFSADIIYHLFDSFTAYQKELLEKKRRENADQAVYPCVLKTIQIINKRNPMIIGVDVVQGSVRIGTPITVVKADPATGAKQILPLGRVVSLEVNHKSTEIVKKGQTNAGVAMRLSDPSAGQPIWGRHVDEKDNLYSQISRKSIDVLKDPAFRDSVPRDDWLLIKNLKPIFDIN
ncbi:hypothetical protein D0Z00_001360 [Geotrichum galactomycetum]|uniref:Uncharacterized protein n=1 Tax=Geotrichum galactomycetum TaxID=27317 RepID=A0ACB6V793_9ASCO|nr:hypothetical protein D0Z00_001360 [Geotrichum candidum]